MKPLYPFIIFTLSLSLSQNVFSNDNVIISVASSCEETILENEYLEYKFGFSKIVTVIVIRRFDNYIISINCDGEKNRKCLFIKDSDILDWAFEKMPSELEKARYSVNELYSPSVASLTFVDKNNCLDLHVSSKMEINGDEELKEHIKN